MHSKHSLSLFVQSLFTLFILTVLISCQTGSQVNIPSSGVGLNVEDGDSDIATDQAFVVTFNAAVDTDTVTASSFFIVLSDDAPASLTSTRTVGDNALCDVTLALDASVTCESDTSCTLTPTNPLEADAEYILCLTDSIQYKNPATDGLFQAVSFTFVTAPAFSVGGSVSGLSGSVVLQNNAGDNLSVTSDGNFEFATALTDESAYAVTVITEPDNQTCAVTSGTGTITGANVTSVSVICTDDTFSVGGTISGLFTGYEMELSNNGSDSLIVEGTADGNVSFTFPTALEDEADYVVAVADAPQDCDVTAGSGTINGADTDTVAVTCSQEVMFVSTSTYNGNLKGGMASGTAGGDAKCAADVQCPDGFVCQAMLGAVLDSERTACTTANCSGGPSEHVDWVLSPKTAYVRPDGTTVVGVTNTNAIFDFNLDNAAVSTSQTAWVGLEEDWTTHFLKCFSWRSEDSGSDQGAVGNPSLVDGDFLDVLEFSGPLCSTVHHLICVTNGTL